MILKFFLSASISILVSTPAFAQNGQMLGVEQAKAKMQWESEANVNATDPEGSTLLNSAAWVGNLELVQKLLARGADPNIADKQGITPLIGAVVSKDIKVVRALLEKGAKVNVQDKDFDTPLGRAAGDNLTEIALLLIECGANVNVKDKKGSTPLHAAATLGNAVLARKLLERAAKVDERDSDGATPLLHGANDLEIVNLLLKAKANINARDKEGSTVLHEAMVLWPNPAATARLIEAKADVNAKNQDGETPLHGFIYTVSRFWFMPKAPSKQHDLFQSNARAVLKTLLQAKADPLALDNKGNSPISILEARFKDAPALEKENLRFLLNQLETAQKKN